ncbi:MAG: alpha-ketoacid dehydrogenase subunit beta [Chloroflexi bacterium]|nr:alpha-ketoacid dehydrogenase subunit beta [Chloroflexota bacterium]
MPQKNVVEAVRDALLEEMERDPTVILMGEDVGERGGVFRATEGLLAKFGPERVIDAPLAESSIVGVAIGAAVNGFRPVAEIQFADFILPAVNQLISEAAKLRYRSNGAFGRPLTVRTPYGGGVHGALYHSQSIEALFAHIPGLKVVAPSTPYDTKGLLKAAIRDPDPVLFLEHKRAYRLIRGEVPEGEYVLPIGKAEVKRQGTDLSLITYGLTVHYGLQAAEELAREGVSVEVLDLRTLLPLDREAVLATAKKTGKVLIAHEDNLTGGLGGEVAAIIAQDAFEWLDAPVMRLAGPDVPAMGYAKTLEDAYMLSPEKIAAALRKLAAY